MLYNYALLQGKCFVYVYVQEADYTRGSARWNLPVQGRNVVVQIQALIYPEAPSLGEIWVYATTLRSWEGGSCTVSHRLFLMSEIVSDAQQKICEN